jgi:hypothetical protein
MLEILPVAIIGTLFLRYAIIKPLENPRRLYDRIRPPRNAAEARERREYRITVDCIDAGLGIHAAMDEIKAQDSLYRVRRAVSLEVAERPWRYEQAIWDALAIEEKAFGKLARPDLYEAVRRAVLRSDPMEFLIPPAGDIWKRYRNRGIADSLMPESDIRPAHANAARKRRRQAWI